MVFTGSVEQESGKWGWGRGRGWEGLVVEFCAGISDDVTLVTITQTSDCGDCFACLSGILKSLVTLMGSTFFKSEHALQCVISNVFYFMMNFW